jgi:hypothetical protein
VREGDKLFDLGGRNIGPSIVIGYQLSEIGRTGADR